MYLKTKWNACLLAATALYIIVYGGAPHMLLVKRMKKLELRNKKLHEDLHILQLAADQHLMNNLPTTNRTRKHLSSVSHQDEDQDISNAVDRCETVHVAIVAAGIDTAKSVVTMVKSILFRRTSPLHLHFISDKMGRHILSTIFKTWDLPAVTMSFYQTEDAIKQISWVKNSHYSGVFGLMKLTLPSLLPKTLKKVIVLDTDLMFASDIALLWQFFHIILRQGRFFGLVENQSDWYLGNLWKNHRPWPALGRGFNTGVMLLNLEAMRRNAWSDVWQNVTHKSLKKYHSTALADQDIINAAIQENKELVYILPCAFNVQLSEHTLSDYCYKDAEQFKVIHWNSGAKLNVKNIHGPYFKNLYKMFQNYDGNLLKHELFSCNSSISGQAQKEETNHKDPCLDFTEEKNHKHRTHPYFIGHEANSRSSSPTDSSNDVTLISQMSMDRLQMLEPLCKHWQGPLSVTLYASDSEQQQMMEYIEESSYLRDYKKLSLHVVSKSSSYYPVNYLRNVALENTQTDFVFLSDIDFLPMYGLHQYLKEAIRVLGAQHRALIVPAFETLLYRFDFPMNKTDLLSKLDDNTVYTFRYHVWKQGHAPTNFEHWRSTHKPYEVSWAADFEPYVAVRRNVTRYDERFVGFGWNKVSHIMELDAQGYEFVVLPGAFMIHMPHAPSLEISKFRKSTHYRDCLQVLKRQFQGELTEKYGVRKNKV